MVQQTSHEVVSPSTAYENGPTKPSAPEPKWKQIVFGVPGVILGAVIGVLVGIWMKEGGASNELTTWIALPGDLFIRALKCLVAPLVFCSLVTGMSDMVSVGKASSIGWRTAVAYTITTVVAAAQGLIWVLIFRGAFNPSNVEDSTKIAEMAFQCSNDNYLTQQPNGSVICAPGQNNNGTFTNASTFVANDINGYFEKTEKGYAKLSLSESLQMQIKQMVPDNITQAFADSALLSIVMFAIPFGLVIALLPKEHRRVIGFFKELNLILMNFIRGIIVLTPFAVVFLLANAVASQTQDLGNLFADVGTLIACVTIGLILHAFVVLPIFLSVFARVNPIAHYKHIVPAQVFALGCASSMATLPVTMRCVDATKACSKALSRFVLSLGATINMDGSALYYPAAIVFMAATSGQDDIVGGVEMFLIILVSTIGAVGSAPVPAAGIVMTITIWSSVFPNIALPTTFSYIVATDWLLDRFITATNVTGDTVIVRIIAYMVNDSSEDVDVELRNSLDHLASKEFLQNKDELSDHLNDRPSVC